MCREIIERFVHQGAGFAGADLHEGTFRMPRLQERQSLAAHRAMRLRMAGVILRGAPKIMRRKVSGSPESSASPQARIVL